MPDANVAKTLIRVFDLLRLLPRFGPGKTAGAMHEELLRRGYEIEKRTVERDLRMLQSAFPEYLGCDDKTKPFGWHWQPGKELCITNIQPGEALLLELVAKTLQATLPAALLTPLAPRFAQATATLQEQTHGRYSPVVLFPAQKRETVTEFDHALLEEIVSALLAREQIEVSLPAEEGTEQTRAMFTPVTLMQIGTVTYLIAFRASSQTPEHFALHRLQHVVRLNRRGEVPPQSFVLEQYVASLTDSLHQPSNISLQASIRDNLRENLLDAPLAADQHITRHGDAWHLQATVPAGSWLVSWILQQGAAIRVDQPAELRAAVSAEIGRMAEAYARPD